MALQGWSALLQPLVAQYGPIRVWNAGLQCPDLGFPPSWITTVDEAKKLGKVLESGL